MSDLTLLLGGAERKRARVRGFAPGTPQKETLALIARVNAVLHEYADHLPLTIRQIFYRLVGAHGYDKTERAYKRLGEHLNRARRAVSSLWTPSATTAASSSGPSCGRARRSGSTPRAGKPTQSCSTAPRGSGHLAV